MSDTATGTPWRALAVPVAVGAVLRLWNLPDQVLGGDELHALRLALTTPLGEILTTYQAKDACLPLTAFYRLWLEGGGRLSEAVMRAPMVLAGLATLVAVPALTARVLGRAGAVLLAWLVALAPMLVMYSRIARSYGVIVLLGFGALAAFDRWWSTGRRGAAVAYALLAALAVWFHPLALPFVGAPLLFGLGDLALRRGVPRRPSLVGLVVTGAALIAALASFLVPARESLLALLEKRGGSGEFELSAATGAARLLAGTSLPLLTALVWALALVGLALLFRRRPRWAALSATVCAVQLVGLILLSPHLLHHTIVLGRYVVIVLPLVLGWVAAALTGAPSNHEERLALPRAFAGGALLVALFAAGPLTGRTWYAGSFAHHNDVVGFEAPAPVVSPEALPPFYGGDLEPGPLLVLPWPTQWRLGRSFPAYQRVHGRRVLVVPDDEQLGDERLALRNTLAPEGDPLATAARYLVIHLDLPAEEGRLPEHRETQPMTRHQRESLQITARMAERESTRSWGAPDHRDDQTVAWDLDRVRARRDADG